MARETITRLVDDVDGGVAHETVRFGLDGRLYEIDLSSKNAKKLRGELATFIKHGNRVSARSGPARRGRGSAAAKDHNRTIREWAQANGYEVSSRGRIRQDVIDAFRQHNR
jgi:Lsr2